MEWWTHLWLNEGFATWIEYLCVDHTHPEYEIWTNFLSREYAAAMRLDALANSHPIEVRERGGRGAREREKLNIYSETSLIRTPLGQTKVSLIERCPHFRSC